MQVALVSAQKLLRTVTLAVEGEVEHVVRMGGIAQVGPQPRRAQQISLRVLQLYGRIIGVQGTRTQCPVDQSLIQGPQQYTTGHQPIAQRGSRQEETLT